MIIQIIFNVVTFFKKLIVAAMDEVYLKSCGEYYATHKETILNNYKKLATTTNVEAIPPKNTKAFNSDNKIALSVSQTVNILEEIDRSFKQRVDLWDQQNKYVNNHSSNTIFDEIKKMASNASTHVKDSLILGKLGIRLNFDVIPVLSLYDPQVKE
jgi:hypothetical protein